MSISVALTGAASPLPASPSGTSATNKPLTAQASEFEAMLLTQWLQSSESTFGSAPGEEDTASAGDEQIKSFALQQLASGIAAKGGIGISRYVSTALAAAQSQSPAPASVASPRHDQGK